MFRLYLIVSLEVSPVDRQTWAGYLHPRSNLLEASKLGWEDLGEEHDEVPLTMPIEQSLDLFKHLRIALPTESAQNDTE